MNYDDQSKPIPNEFYDKSNTFKFDLFRLESIIIPPSPVMRLKWRYNSAMSSFYYNIFANAVQQLLVIPFLLRLIIFSERLSEILSKISITNPSDNLLSSKLSICILQSLLTSEFPISNDALPILFYCKLNVVAPLVLLIISEELSYVIRLLLRWNSLISFCFCNPFAKITIYLSPYFMWLVNYHSYLSCRTSFLGLLNNPKLPGGIEGEESLEIRSSLFL